MPPTPVDAQDALTIVLPDDVLPWLRDIKVKIPESMMATSFTADLCLAPGDDPNDCLAKKGMHIELKPDNTAKKDRSYPLELAYTESEKYPNFLLLPDHNYAFCLHWSGNSYCKTFTVRQPLFQVMTDPKQKPGPLGVRMAFDEASPKPYYVSNGNPLVVVFGVVDKNLMHQVGLLNYSWWNDDSKYDTTVQAIDPAKALQQVLDMCKQDADCRNKPKVLLAQMDPQSARELVSTLQKPGDSNIFDVVITQVDARDYTGTVTQSAKRDEADVAAGGPLVLVPAPHYATPLTKEKMSIKMQRAEVSFDDYAHPERAFSLVNKVTNYDLTPPPSKQAQALAAAVAKAMGVSKPGGKEPFEELALDRMRKFCRADLAMMQPRDVFEQFSVSVGLWSRNEPGEHTEAMFSRENLMDEALWKGDLIVCRALSGADLKKALKQSDGSPALTKLKYLGVEKDNLHENYIVGGQAVDEKRLYSVALTDFLAFGDTGYSDLSASDVGVPDTIRSMKNYKLVAEAAFEGLKDKEAAAQGLMITAKSAVIAAPGLYEHANVRPPLSTPRFDEIHQLADWAEHWWQAYAFTPALKPAKGVSLDPQEQKAQSRGYNYFNLEKLTLGYSLTAIEGPQQLVPVRFGGISNVPQLQTLESQSVSLWERIRYGRVFPKWIDIFGSGEARYGFSRTRLTAYAGYDPYKINITENSLQAESGILTKRISETIPFRLLLSERLSTQLRAPLLSYSALTLGPPASAAPSNCKVTSIDTTPPVTASSTSSILCAAPRSILQETKIGTRLENRENWIEFGWEVGHNFNSVSGYDLNKTTAAEVDCSATTNQSVTSCIGKAAAGKVTALSPLYVTQQTLPVSGWFLNFKVSAPVYGKTVQFSIENYSEVFLQHTKDTSADTRFYQDTVVALPVKIWQNLSISPQVEIFNYQNKVLPQHFLSLASKLTLDYNFDWHSGIKAKRAATFPDAGNATKAAPLPVP